TESLFVAMLMHVSLTASLLILNPLDISGAHLVAYSFALAGALWVVVGVVALANRKETSREPLSRRAARQQLGSRNKDIMTAIKAFVTRHPVRPSLRWNAFRVLTWVVRQ